MNLPRRYRIKKFPFAAALVFLVFFSKPHNLNAQSPVVIDGSFNHERLGPHLEILIDNENKLTINDITSGKIPFHFLPSTSSSPNFGYTRAAVWARFTVRNTLKSEYTWFLEFSQPWVDHADLYIPQKKGFSEIKAGDTLPFKAREVRDRNFIFPVRQPPGESTFYMRFKTTSSLSLDLTAYSSESLADEKSVEVPLLWLYYGLLIAMILYNLFIYLSIKDKSYLYYVYSIFLLVLYSMSYNGTGYQYFWPDNAAWANRSISVFLHLFAAGFYLFTKSFLNTRDRMPRFNLVFSGFAVTHFIELIIVLVLSPGKADGLAVYTSMVGLPVIAAATILSVRKGHRSAKIYSIAWGIFLLMAGVTMLRGLGILPQNLLTHYSVHIGSSVAVILFSFGLADRISSMREARMMALEALNQSEEKYRTLVESINDVIYMIDNDGRFTYISPAINHISSLYKIEDIIGRPMTDFIHPDDIPLVLQSRRKTLSGDIHPLEHRLLDRDGRVIHVRTFSRPVFVGGVMTGVSGVLNDITEYRKMVDALNESEEKYRSLVENATESIFVTQGSLIKFFNRGAVLASLYDEQEILTRPFTDFIHPEDREPMMDRYKKRINGESVPNAYQFRIINKKGETRWMEINAVKIAWEGEPAVLNFMTDVTDRRNAEEQLQASLHEKELLLKEVHHRVKNNMQVISSLLNLQVKFIRDDQDRDIFMDSQNRIRSMSLIHEKIYKSKDFVKINFAEYIQDLAYSLYRTYNVNQSKVKLIISAEDIFIGIDMAIPCGLVINELLSNSLKHAFPDGRKGEIYIILGTETEPDGERHRLVVRDDGVGIKQDTNLEDPETLGLQLVTTLVKQLWGSMEMDSLNGTGFTITFPAVR